MAAPTQEEVMVYGALRGLSEGLPRWMVRCLTSGATAADWREVSVLLAETAVLCAVQADAALDVGDSGEQ